MIRTIQSSDIALIAKFEREISLISFGDDAITDLSFHEEKIKKAMDKEREGMMVLELERNISGWLWMAKKMNYLSKAVYVNFKSFYILDNYRGSEHVNALMNEGISFCERIGAESISSKVHVDNLPMRILYKQFGFAPTHLSMELNLKGKD
ncbi:GNAT family N-acetyltransferase [Paenibacillus sp. NPDC057934]|uniref:GNAT family N-acetyltransferase n=1 Tax=Paenibacillus sp. NPDC057934 TaxID=3346282 RepID=UPI0036DA5F94